MVFFFKLFRNCFALACLLLAWTNGGFILASGNAGSGNAAAPANRLPACPVSFLMDAVADARGNVWVAAEAGGVWKLEAGTWRAMHREPGFPPTMNCYAIAEDLQGRIWVGMDNQGVAVWNGETWKTYDQLSGLLGERVFAIRISPVTGLVALATSGGLSLYDPAGKTWRGITRAEGLLEDQIEALAFTPGEDLHVAYQCGGVSSASRRDGYGKWRHSQARWYWDRGQRMRQPAERCGTFLPSNLCNAIAVQEERVVWIGTNAGLVRGINGKYLFTRGRDFQEKNKGLFGGMPKDYRPVESMVIDPVPDLLPEDYITVLFPTPDGIWVGFRQQGAALVDARTMKMKKRALHTHSNVRARWVRAFVALPGGRLCAATNGGGLLPVGESGEKRHAGKAVATMAKEHPVPMPYADGEECRRLEQLFRQPDSSAPAPVTYFHEDWSTQGDWCERYGINYAMLCAMNAPINNVTYNFSWGFKFSVGGWMGPHRKKNDDLRHWVHWVNKPDNRNVLFCPTSGTRTEAEWDDHGEVYSYSFDGPDVWALVRVPEGRHLVSLYFYNPNGREKLNGHRDFVVEARKILRSSVPPKILTRDIPIRELKLPPDCMIEELERQLASPVLARCRVKDFSGSGVYKTFLMNGGGCYGFRVVRNNSMNTILNGVFLTGLASSARKNRLMRAAYGPVRPQPPSVAHLPLKDIPREALSLWSACQSWDQGGNRWIYQWKRCAFRAYTALLRYPDRLDDLMSAWRWQLGYWTPQDRVHSAKMLEDTWASNQEDFVPYRSRNWTPYSPNVVSFTVEECGNMLYTGLDWKEFRNMEPDHPKVLEAKKVIREYIRNKEKQKK